MITTTHKKILIPLALVRSRLRNHYETMKNQTTKNQTTKNPTTKNPTMKNQTTKNPTTKINTLFDSSARLMKPRLAFVTFSLLCIAPLAHSQTATRPDLDRDGIPNISDPDVDNDGVRNGADLNIDGGMAKSGPLKGQYIGDRIANDNAAELDMDADGLLDNAANESDIDGDGLADNSKLELDIDADARPDTAANETDIDGDSVLDNAVAEKDIDGDGQLDNAAAETDIDGDALADNAANETDIDGDGLADDAVTETDIDGDSVLDNAVAEQDIDGDGLSDEASNEFDMDGDGVANNSDADWDGDGLADNSDADIYGSDIDVASLDILYESPGKPSIYVADALVAPTIAFVSTEVRKALQIPVDDMGLRVRVLTGDGTGNQPGQLGNYVRGVWRYYDAFGIKWWAIWCYPVSNPSQLKIFVATHYYLFGNADAKVTIDIGNPEAYFPLESSEFNLGFPEKDELSAAGIEPSSVLFLDNQMPYRTGRIGGGAYQFNDSKSCARFVSDFLTGVDSIRQQEAQQLR